MTPRLESGAPGVGQGLPPPRGVDGIWQPPPTGMGSKSPSVMKVTEIQDRRRVRRAVFGAWRV